MGKFSDLSYQEYEFIVPQNFKCKIQILFTLDKADLQIKINKFMSTCNFSLLK